MEIRTLEDCSLPELLSAFNESFTGYFVPLQLSMEQLENKIASEGLDLRYSVGAFRENKLCGFILHAWAQEGNKKLAYNAGTGVVPAERKKRLTQRMYDFLLPALLAHGFERINLEVITENIPAIKTYEQVGFKTKRGLLCYKGEFLKANVQGIPVKTIQEPDWEELASFWDFIPTWQNSIHVIERSKNKNLTYAAFMDDQVAGYIVFNPLTNRIIQLATDPRYRRNKVGTALLSCLSERASALSVINVDENSAATTSFLEHAGLRLFIRQKEMVLQLQDLR